MKNIFLFLIICFLLSGSLSAQKKNPKDTLNVTYKNMIVTATRYPERLLEVPMAASIIDRYKLETIKGYGMEEILNTIPGILVQSRSGNQDVRITIRGFGARGAGDRSNSGTSRGIKIYLDGIPETEPDGRTAFDDIDLSTSGRIEVIRSNSSAIWGNAAGGIVSIYSEPVFKDNYLKFSTIGGSYGLIKNSLELGSKVGEGKLYGSVSHTKFDGYRANSESERYLANFGLNSTIGNNTSVKLNVIGVSNKFNIPGPLTQAQYDADPEQANTTYLSRNERRFNRSLKMGVTVEHFFDDNNSLQAMTFVNPKFLQRSERGTFRDFTRYHIGGSMSYKNVLNCGDNKNIALFGVDEAYQDGAILFYALDSLNNRSANLSSNKREGANTLGAYFQDEFMFGDKLSVILGVRYDRISYYSEDFTGYNLSQDMYFDRLTPKAAISYRITPHSSVYVNYGGGVEVPAGNETDPIATDSVNMVNPLLEPIISTTYECGYKEVLEFEDGIINLIDFDIAMFMIDVKNDLIPYNGGRFYFSAGKTNRLGAELAFNIHTKYDLTLRTAFTLMKTKYDEYSIDSTNLGKAGVVVDYKDNEIAGIPGLFYNVGLQYDVPVVKGLFAEVSAQGVGKYFVDDANKYEVPSYTIINATLGLNKPVYLYEKVGIKGFVTVNNLLDEKYVASAFVNPDLDKKTKLPVYLEAGLPRNFVLGFSICWE